MRNWKPDDLGHLQDAFVRTRYFKKSLEKKRWPSHYAWPWNKFTNLVCKVHPGRKMISHVLWKRCKEKNKQTTYSRKNQHTSKSRTLECIRGGKSNFVRLFFFRFFNYRKTFHIIKTENSELLNFSIKNRAKNRRRYRVCYLSCRISTYWKPSRTRGRHNIHKGYCWLCFWCFYLSFVPKESGLLLWNLMSYLCWFSF